MNCGSDTPSQNLSNNSANSVLTQITSFKNDYYSTNSKNRFFKKKQKDNLAKSVCENFDLETLITKSIYIISNTCKIYIDYPILKLYLNESNYSQLIDYIIHLYNVCIERYNYFDFHINLETFSVSAAERYKYIIESFSDRCLLQGTQYSEIMQKLYIYNTPQVMESIMMIFRPFIPPIVSSKIIMYSKVDSPKLLENLYDP